MQEVLETILLNSWDEQISDSVKTQVIKALESGKVIYLPNLAFNITQEESSFLSPHIVNPKSKNISYDIRKDELGGSLCQEAEAAALKSMVKRYAMQSRHFFDLLFPPYLNYVKQARTSFRPVEASGRHLSYRKDDTRLHVDAFPSNPVKGERILRFFTNVNPNGKPRVWRLGEPFEDVVKKMSSKVNHPMPGVAPFLKFFGITKDYRTPYDHYMLQIHDGMKGDTEYQKTAPQKEVLFPAGSSWIVFSDQVSHAAMSGQHLFEQTFYLPVQAMVNPETTPLKVLERHFKKALV